MLACPDDDDAIWKAPFQRQHTAAEYARYSGAGGQNLGQPVAGARVDSGVTHNGRSPAYELKGRKHCGDAPGNFRADFDFQFNGLAIRLGGEGERVRPTGPDQRLQGSQHRAARLCPALMNFITDTLHLLR
jgi:hypothetical protein